jgi:hypothetical protein
MLIRIFSSPRFHQQCLLCFTPNITSKRRGWESAIRIIYNNKKNGKCFSNRCFRSLCSFSIAFPPERSINIFVILKIQYTINGCLLPPPPLPPLHCATRVFTINYPIMNALEFLVLNLSSSISFAFLFSPSPWRNAMTICHRQITIAEINKSDVRKQARKAFFLN